MTPPDSGRRENDPDLIDFGPMADLAETLLDVSGTLIDAGIELNKAERRLAKAWDALAEAALAAASAPVAPSSGRCGECGHPMPTHAPSCHVTAPVAQEVCPDTCGDYCSFHDAAPPAGGTREADAIEAGAIAAWREWAHCEPVQKWSDLPESFRDSWRKKVACVVRAALAERGAGQEGEP